MKTVLFSGFTDFFVENWPYIVAFVVLAGLTYLLLTVLGKARTSSEQQLKQLLQTDVDTYLERLNNNKMLSLVFPRSSMLLFKLDGALAKGDDDTTRQIIAKLDKMCLDPGEKVDYLQKRMSFFIYAHDNEQAKQSYADLKDMLTKLKATDTPKYRDILEEGQSLIRIYIDKDVSFIDSLIQKATRTQQKVVRGITQYRVARLAYLKGDQEMVDKYLRRASVNVVGTYYQSIVAEAIADNSQLDK